MKKTLISLLTVMQVFSSAASAQESLGPYAHLNRLSRTLKGYAPSPAERAELQIAITQGNANVFLDKKAEEYLKSEEHAYKMSVRLDELFRVQTDGSPIKSAMNDPAADNYGPGFFFYRNNSLNYLFNEIAKNNLSWDELLTGKSYRLFYQAKGFPGITDWGFIAGLVPQLKATTGVISEDASLPIPSATPEYLDINFKENDPRIAGAITTNRFFGRYTNTGINKNRRRAAAIFRIFLCDSMSAAVTSSEGMDDQILDLMFPHGSQTTENNLRKALTDVESLHGSQPDCMACHYKLDPMGKTLLTSQSALSPTASAGRLTYKKANGNLVDIPVRGIGDLGKAITMQDEYKSCQVQHFWKWFMGDRPLTTERKAELVKKFDDVGRRTNDFIKHLVQLPEFSSPRIILTETQLQARNVKAFLQKCQDCHKDQFYEDSPDFKFPDFTVWPIGGSEESMKTWTRLISKNMDIEHNGENPRMPPTMAAWRTSYKEMQLIKKWITQGAPNEKGETQLKAGSAK